jgi:Ser/Thr protein kinase RdoA (MazF antagonist)
VAGVTSWSGLRENQLMSGLGDVIRARCAAWGVVALPLERAVFGTDDPDALAAAVDRWCRAHLGAAIARYRFFDSSSGSVHGVQLDDGREVVVKVHRPGLGRAYLDALYDVQATLVANGCAGPRPLVAPVPAPPGHIVAEEMLGPFVKPDAHDPAVRRTLAAGLADFVRLGRAAFPELDPRLVHPMTVSDDALYPEPHSPRFDFEATSAGAEWIDELALAARGRLAACDQGPVVLTHGDWRIDNVRVDAGRVVAIYDWDSVCVQPEAAAVATAALTFCCDWGQSERRRFPAPGEITAFIAEYERARGAAFNAAEKDFIAASMVATLAYGARCEHADPYPTDRGADSQQGMLHALGAPLLDHGLGALA